MHFGRLRLVCDEIHEVVAENDAPGRGAYVDAQREAGRVDLTRLAAVVLDVVQEVLQPLHEARATGVHRLFDHRGVHPRHVARRDRVGHQLDREASFAPRRLRQPRGIHQLLRRLRPHEILFDRAVQERVALPGRVGEAFVVVRHGASRLGVLAAHAPQCVEPDRLLGDREAREPCGQQRRVHHDIGDDGAHCIAERGRIDAC